MQIVLFIAGAVAGAAVTWLVLRERLAAQGRAVADVEATFQALSAEALRANNEAFLTLAQTRLDGAKESAAVELDRRRDAVEQLVKPIAESLGKVDARIADLERARTEAYSALTTQVGALTESQRALQSETANLVTALRSPHVRGRWGEMQLRRVVEAAGMVSHCDFAEQTTIGSGEQIGRPDLIVRLAGGKNVVVDAKAPLQAYLEAVEAKDDATRTAKLEDHARQLRDHVLKLGAKGYWAQLESTPEFVVLFIPGEAIFGAALEHDAGLIDEAAKRRVILATPTTLIAVLWAIAHGWREERLAENARVISELGRDLHTRIGTLAGHFAKLRRSIDGVVRAYNDAAGSLESRVLVSARRLKDLGTTSTGEIEALEPVESIARPLSAPELTASDAVELPAARDAA